MKFSFTIKFDRIMSYITWDEAKGNIIKSGDPKWIENRRKILV